MIRYLIFIISLSLLISCSTHSSSELTPAEARYHAAQKEIATLTPAQYLSHNGDIYIGDIVHGTAEGYGKLTTPDGTRYTGAFKAGIPHGFGVTEASDGALYEGEHKAGKFHGRGKITFSNQSAFMGEFRNNKIYRGLMVFPNGKAVEI